MRSDVTKREDYYESNNQNQNDDNRKNSKRKKFEKTPDEKIKNVRIHLAITWLIVLLLVSAFVVYIAYVFLSNEDEQVLLKEDESGSVHIYSLNDYRGSFYQTEKEAGLSELTYYLNQLEEDNKIAGDESLFLMSGNNLYGTLESDSNQGELLSKSFNEMNISYSSIGSHDFDTLTFENYVSSMFQIEGASNMQFLSANLIQKNEGELLPFADPYAIEEFDVLGVGSINIGILGLTSQDILTSGNPEVVSHLDVIPPAKAARTYVPQMQEEGADIIIALTDLPATQIGDEVMGSEINALSRVWGIDAIFGSNSDNVVNTKVNNIPVVQSLGSGKGISEISINLEERKNGYKIDIETNVNIFEDEISSGGMSKRNNYVESLYFDYIEPFSTFANRVLLSTEFDLTKNYNASNGKTTQLGALLSDLVMYSFVHEINSKDNLLINSILENVPIISVFNNESTFATLEKGDLSVSELYRAIPYTGNLEILFLTGQQVYDMFEKGLNHNLSSNTRTPDLIQYDYGVKVIADSNYSDGNTIERIEILDPKIRKQNLPPFSPIIQDPSNYNVLENDAELFVITNSLIADGNIYGDIEGQNITEDKDMPKLTPFELLFYELNAITSTIKTSVEIPTYYNDGIGFYTNRYVQ